MGLVFFFLFIWLCVAIGSVAAHLDTRQRGALLYQAAWADGRVMHAIGHLRTNFGRTVRIYALAEIAGMSTPTSHRHFRVTTPISSLQ